MVLIICILQIRIDEFNQSLLFFIIVYRRTDHNNAIALHCTATLLLSL